MCNKPLVVVVEGANFLIEALVEEETIESDVTLVVDNGQNYPRYCLGKSS